MEIDTILAKTLEFISKILAEAEIIIKKLFSAEVLSSIGHLLKTIGIYLVKFFIMIFDFLSNLLKNLLTK